MLTPTVPSPRVFKHLLFLLLALAGCSDGGNGGGRGGKLNTFDVEEAGAPSPAPTPAGPQIAYSYDISYRLPSSAIGATQARHLGTCRAFGPSRCVVVSTQLNRRDGDDEATTRLLVDARVAAAFGRRLDAGVEAGGGRIVSRSVEAEDLTRQIVDTGARIRAKQALADRLLRLIGTSNGRVGDLVAAEKAFADVQEELDAARGNDAALRRRVALSRIDLAYASSAATGTWAPVRSAFASAGDSFAFSAGMAVTFVVAAIPWLVLVLPLGLALRAGWRRWRRRKAARTA